MADEAEADNFLDQPELELRRLYGQAALHIQKLQQRAEHTWTKKEYGGIARTTFCSFVKTTSDGFSLVGLEFE